MKNPRPKLLIIGAGVSGLCAGVYARKAGFETEIVEMNAQAGGLAMSWRRKDYVFETCLHWLLGSRPGSAWHSLWQEVFDIDSLRFVDAEDFARLETESGSTLVIPRDVERFEEALLKYAPEDALPIKRLARGIRRFRGFDLPLPGTGRWRALGKTLRMAPYLPELRYWSRLSQADLARQFRNPLLRQFFEGGERDLSALALVFSLAWMSDRDAGYAIGGSQAVIQGIEKSFRALGGSIRFNAKVERILVERRKAAGVRLTSGEELRSDWVISAADIHSTLFDWLPEKFRDEKATRPYASLQTFPSYLQISFGIRRDLRQLPGAFTRILNEPLAIDPQTEARQLSFRVFHFDPTFAPAGKTAVTCFIPTRNDTYWTRLQKTDPNAYASEKKRISDAVARALDRREPGIRKHIEVTDVSTPATVRETTGNWRGSMEGFLPTSESGFDPLPMRLPRLGRFRMIGQWVLPGGGLPSGLMTARSCIREISRIAGLKFPVRASPRPVRRMRG
ncbi:MAG: NAD(P)/FAD-dependent oxidoreductase [Oligoflexia bacterium]|nr:NAD(P)/FAD-dependent oxidoreductase [Oligoflexia bacterium]